MAQYKTTKSLFTTIAKEMESNNNAQMKRYRDLVVKRAKVVHTYKNRTHQLTNTLRGIYSRRNKTIGFYSTDYAKYVIAHYNQNWVKNSANFYLRKKSLWE